jgi:hypothetical protein
MRPRLLRRRVGGLVSRAVSEREVREGSLKVCEPSDRGAARGGASGQPVRKRERSDSGAASLV